MRNINRGTWIAGGVTFAIVAFLFWLTCIYAPFWKTPPSTQAVIIQDLTITSSIAKKYLVEMGNTSGTVVIRLDQQTGTAYFGWGDSFINELSPLNFALVVRYQGALKTIQFTEKGKPLPISINSLLLKNLSINDVSLSYIVISK